MLERYGNYIKENKRKLADKDPTYVKAYVAGTAMFVLAFTLFIIAVLIHLFGGFTVDGLAAGIGDFIHTISEHAFRN